LPPVVLTQASTASLLCNTRPEPKKLENCRLCAVSVF
jgi:hypothetical protein